jgi:hypothetical protein
LVIVQSIITLRGTILPMYRDARDVRGLPALQRSAIIAFGDTFAAYIGFLRSQIPETGRVVIPPPSADPVFGNTGLMQYYLFPRQIVNCPDGPDVDICTRSMDAPATVLLRIDGFPDPDAVPSDKGLRSFNNNLGIYLLSSAEDAGPEPLDVSAWEAEATPATTTARVAAGLMLVVALLLLGAMLIAAFLSVSEVRAQAAMAFPLGLGVFTWTLFLGSWAGMRISWHSALLLLASLLLLAITLARRKARVAPRAACPSCHLGLPATIGLAIVVVGLGLLSVSMAYSAWDAMAIWSVKAYGLASEGNLLAGERWGAHGLDYPLNLPLAIATMRVLQGDTGPLSKLFFPIFYASLILGCAKFWLRRSVPRSVALASALILATSPILVQHATNGYVNLAFASYLILGSLAIVDGHLSECRPLQSIGGSMLGLAMWTRAEGTLLVSLLLPILYFALTLLTHKRPCLGCIAVPATIIGGTVFAFTSQHGAGGQLSVPLLAASAQLQAGQLRLDAIYRTLRTLAGNIVNFWQWGMLLPSGLMFIAYWLTILRRRNPSGGLALVIAGLALAGGILAYFYLLAFESTAASYQMWMDTGVDRIFLPAIMLGWAGLVTWVAGDGTSSRESAASAGDDRLLAGTP